MSALQIFQDDDGLSLVNMFAPWSTLQIRTLHLEVMDVQGSLSTLDTIQPFSTPIWHLTIYSPSGRVDDHSVQMAIWLWPTLQSLVVVSQFCCFDQFHPLIHLTTLFISFLPSQLPNGTPVFLAPFLSLLPQLQTLTVLGLEYTMTLPTEQQLHVPTNQNCVLTNIHRPPILVQAIVQSDASTDGFPAWQFICIHIPHQWC